jgi:osmotically-inducible protein OsmY
MRNRIAIALLCTFISLPAWAARPDAWITTKAKIALWTAKGIDSSDIHVDTINGTITLHGKTDSVASKQNAEREAKRIDGVKNVRNLLQVVPSEQKKAISRSDKEIKDAITSAFKADDTLTRSSFDVASVSDGVVLLKGKADDLSDEARAVRIARRVDGVRQVVSEIKGTDRFRDEDDFATTRRDVTPTRDTAAREPKRRMPDSFITSDVKMRLLAEENVPALDINVDTDDGVVKLFGTVPSNEAKQAAELQARKVTGVTRVENDLQIVPSARKEIVKKSDKELEKQVKTAMEQHGDLDGVDVEVKAGVVRLTGTVPTRTQKLEAAVVSRSTRGVRSVNNDLQIKSKGE